jgi:hypothetical protein
MGYPISIFVDVSASSGMVDVSTGPRGVVPVPDRTVSVLRTHDDRIVPVAGAYDIDGAPTGGVLVGKTARSARCDSERS